MRRYAYWSVFQGAMGHTYGDNAIQQCYSDASSQGAYGVKQVWQESVHHVGSEHMGHLRRLMESVDYQNGRPREDLLLSGQKERYGRIAVFAGEDFMPHYEDGRSVGEDVFARGLCLPSDIKNTDEDMELIIRTVRECFAGYV